MKAGYWTLGATAAYPTVTIEQTATLAVTGSLDSAVTVQPNGELVVGNGTVAGQLAGSVVDNGEVLFDQPGDYTVNGAFSGTGELVKDGPGVLTFGGPYSFAGQGSCSIDDGSIDIADLAPGVSFDMTGGFAVNVSGNATIGNLSATAGAVNIDGQRHDRQPERHGRDDRRLRRRDALTVDSGDFGGDISGLAGDQGRRSNGTLTLSGDDTLGGNVTVAGGALSVTGNLSAPVITVGDGASLGGDGQITGDVTVQAGGVFSPGDPVTTTIVGDVTFVPGSTYLAQVTAGGGHDLIAVTGAVSIQPGATLEVQPLGNATSYARLSQYPIITATTGLTGTFSTVISDAPLLAPHPHLRAEPAAAVADPQRHQLRQPGGHPQPGRNRGSGRSRRLRDAALHGAGGPADGGRAGGV